MGELLLWIALPVVFYFGLSLLNRADETITDTLRAKDAEIDPYQLRVLALHKSAEVRLQIARNPSTPLTVLQKLSEDRDDRVRLAVAERVHEMVCEWGEDVADRQAQRCSICVSVTCCDDDGSFDCWRFRIAT